MNPVFVALTDVGLATARRAQYALGGELHALDDARLNLLPLREKVPSGSAGGRKRGRSTSFPEQPIIELPLSRGPAEAGPHPLPQGERVSALTFTDFGAHLRSLFLESRPIVGICASGILIRVLAPLLSDKREEPPVVAVSEDGASVVPLLGGHRGANELARRIADALGGHAAITTAGDNRFGVALDAPPPGWTLANPEDAKNVMAALLAGASARLEGDAGWLAESAILFAVDGAVRLVATVKSSSPQRGEVGRAARRPGEGESKDPLTRRLRRHPLPDGERIAAAAPLTLIYHPRRLAVGVGCERNADPVEVIDLVRGTLAGAGLATDSVALIASIDLKADEEAILQAARQLGVPARFFSAATLEAETPRLQNPSEAVFREVGAHGVAEAAALAAVGPRGNLFVAKQKSERATCAIAEASEIIDPTTVGRARGRLAIVGIGPGSAEWLTPEAGQLLQASDAVVGYLLYLDLVTPLIAHAERFDSALGAEEARVRQALTLAADGRSVALISSGDAGIYAMAALAFECLDEGVPDAARRFEIEIAPGISAMQAAAARAGAPLGHDFCAISLSDLLTPWETIEMRIRAAAEGDFVVALYNPVSVRRRTQLDKAKQILLEYRPPTTPVVLARNLGRAGESVTAISLASLEVEMVDMLTTVIVGASTTRQVVAGGRTWTYTPRGYAKKRQ